MTPEEIYKKQTGVPATYPFYVHSVGYVKWLEEQNAKLLEALKEAVSEFDRIDYKTPWTETEPEWWLAFSTVARYARQAIAEAEGQS